MVLKQDKNTFTKQTMPTCFFKSD